jgi:hypothetical protein
MTGLILADEYTPIPRNEERDIVHARTGERLLSDYGGVKTWMLHDPVTKTNRIRYSQDVDGILERNQRMQNDGDQYSESRDLQHVASIPLVIVMKWLLEDGIDIFNPNHKEAVRRKLNDPDYRHLRTGMGRL